MFSVYLFLLALLCSRGSCFASYPLLSRANTPTHSPQLCFNTFVVLLLQNLQLQRKW